MVMAPAGWNLTSSASSTIPTRTTGLSFHTSRLGNESDKCVDLSRLGKPNDFCLFMASSTKLFALGVIYFGQRTIVCSEHEHSSNGGR